jgi:hypothetical protein
MARGLKLSTKTKRNIRGLFSVLCDFAAKKEYVPLASRNPVELVRLRRQPVVAKSDPAEVWKVRDQQAK